METVSRSRWWQNTALCKYYARAAAVVLVSVGLAGFGDALSWNLPTSVYHLSMGLLFAYVGLFVRGRETVRRMIGGLGVLLLVVKGVTIFVPLLWGGYPLWGTMEVTCLVLGIGSVLAAGFLRDLEPTG